MSESGGYGPGQPRHDDSGRPDGEARRDETAPPPLPEGQSSEAPTSSESEQGPYRQPDQTYGQPTQDSGQFGQGPANSGQSGYGHSDQAQPDQGQPGQGQAGYGSSDPSAASAPTYGQPGQAYGQSDPAYGPPSTPPAPTSPPSTGDGQGASAGGYGGQSDNQPWSNQPSGNQPSGNQPAGGYGSSAGNPPSANYGSSEGDQSSAQPSGDYGQSTPQQSGDYRQPSSPPSGNYGSDQPTTAFSAPTQAYPYGQPSQQSPSSSSSPYGGTGPSTYGQQQSPSYAGPGYGGSYGAPSGDSSGNWSAPGGAPYGGPGGPPYGGPGGPGAGGPAKKRGRLPLILGLVVVVVLGLGAGAWALFFRGGPAVTWQGRDIANPDAVLSSAQDSLKDTVTTGRGVTNDSTRCYFAIPKSKPASGKATDVDDTVYCGPALFVDGNDQKPYVPYAIGESSTTSGKVTLEVTDKGGPDSATTVPGNRKLVRPDGQTAPSGLGGLSVPKPPPADKDLLAKASDLKLDDAPAGAVMAALSGGVQITKLGELSRFGTGADARSAPDGQKLIGFDLTDVEGESGSGDATALDLVISIDGAAGKPVPDPAGENIIAVPSDAKSVDLVTKANSITQTLSLLNGKPGSSNIAVLARDNRTASFTPPGDFGLTVSNGSATVQQGVHPTGSKGGLFYWIDEAGTQPASAPNRAWLLTDLAYTFTTNTPPPFTGPQAGANGGFQAELLAIQLPDGTKIQAKKVGDSMGFDVPADFTEGTIIISGTASEGGTGGFTDTVNPAIMFDISTE